MIEIGTLTGIIPIAVICWLVGYAVKNLTPIDNKVIPVVVGVLGLILGVAGHYLGILDLDSMDLYTAGAVGILSGAGSVYIHQIYKQFTNKTSGEDSSAE